MNPDTQECISKLSVAREYKFTLEISGKRFGESYWKGMNKKASGTSIVSILSTAWANGPF